MSPVFHAVAVSVFIIFRGLCACTRGSDTVSSADDVLQMSLVRGMRRVGEVCEICMCLARAGWEVMG